MPKKDEKSSSFHDEAHESDLKVDPFEDYEKKVLRRLLNEVPRF